MPEPPAGTQAFTQALDRDETLVPMTWEDWLAMPPPHDDGAYTVTEVVERYQRNGYEWDMHGSLYTPAKARDEQPAFVVFHGGGANEKVMDVTPDGRPGLARRLAAQGFTVLALSYPGLWPRGGEWDQPIAERVPVYLLDVQTGEEELQDRLLKCTFNVILQGAGQLTDRLLRGRRLITFGHSTGGPMAAHLTRFTQEAEVIGVVGWGSGGPDGWRREWRETTGMETPKPYGLAQISRRTADAYRRSHYEDLPELTPWGRMEDFFRLTERTRPQIKIGLRDNQHNVFPARLEEYVRVTGLPRDEYFDHLQDPPSEWLARLKVLLMVGENDHGHWIGGKSLGDKREMFMAGKYAAGGADVHVGLVPKYTHMGHWALHNEKITYAWLWALETGYFD